MKHTLLHKILFLAIIISLAFSLLTFTKTHNWGDDFAQYILQSKSILEDDLKEFEKLFNLWNKVDNAGPIYPWGYPIILVPALHVFGMNILALKAWTYIFFIASSVITYFLFRNKFKTTDILLIILLLVSSPFFYIFKENILSDIPFLFFSLLSIFLIDAFIIEKRYFINKLLSLSLLGAVIFLAYFIRVQGILLIPILIFYQFIRKKDYLNFKTIPRNLNSVIPYLVFFVLVTASLYLLPGSSYSNQVSSLTFSYIKYLIGFSLQNIYYYSTLLADFFGDPDLISDYFQVRSININYVIYGISLPFFILGLIKNYKTNGVYIIYLLLNLTFVIIWPYRQGLRYMFPLIPFYLFFLFKGLKEIDSSNLISSRIKVTYVFVAIVLVFFIGQLFFLNVFYYKSDKFKEGPYDLTSIETFEFVKNNTAKDDIISFFRPRALTLVTDRQSVLTESYEDLLNSGATHFVNYKKQFSGNLKPELEENYSIMLLKISTDNKFIKIFENEDFEIYERGLK